MSSWLEKVSAAGVAFVAVALAGLRYRPWLVVYAGLLGGGLTALGYPAFCPGGADDAIFCHPGLYWWRPVFLLLVAFAGALTVSAALKTLFSHGTDYLREGRNRPAGGSKTALLSECDPRTSNSIKLYFSPLEALERF